MDRPADAVSSRVLCWGVLAPLLVGGFVPGLGPVAVLWLLGGLGTLLAQALVTVVRGADPGEDGGDRDDLYAELGATLPVPGVPGRWWNRPAEDPNTAAARAGSWG